MLPIQFEPFDILISRYGQFSLRIKTEQNDTLKLLI